MTESPNPGNYWKVLKHMLKKEGNESVTNCNQLKLLAADGKNYRLRISHLIKPYKHKQQYREGNQRRAPIAEERQRNPDDRHQTDGHAYVYYKVHKHD